MSSDIAQLQSQLAQLSRHSSVEYTLGETAEGKPAILAGGAPVFRCRSDEVGEAHAHFVVAAMPAIVELIRRGLGDGSGVVTPQPLGLAEPANTGVEAVVRERITTAISLQPDLAQKAPLMAKLIFAAVEPFLSAQCVAHPTSQPGPALAPKPVPQVATLRHEVAGSLIDWLSSNANFPMSDEELALAVSEWEASHGS